MDSKQYNEHDSYAHLINQAPGTSKQNFPRLAMLEMVLASSGRTTDLLDQAFDKITQLLSSGLNRDHAEAAAIARWLLREYPEVGDFAEGVSV